jgi:RND family efflux transporter MFP subunit
MKLLLCDSALILSTLLLAASSGCGEPSAADTAIPLAESGPPLARVMAAKPQRKTLSFSTTQPARIEAFEETPLYAKLAGYVDKVLVDIGDRVTKDQVLVKLAIPELHDEQRQKAALVEQAAAEIGQAQAGGQAAKSDVAAKQAQVAEAEAGLVRADAELERWKAEFNRITQLAESGSVTAKLVDETKNQLQAATASRAEVAAKIESARAAHTQAQAGVAQAQADLLAAQAREAVARTDLARVETMLQYAAIKAPYDGVITARYVDTQHFVHPSTGAALKPLLVVARVDKVRVFVDVPELEASLLNPGDKAVVHVQALGRRSFEAPVTRDAWSLATKNRALRSEIDLSNPDGVLRPGMYATVTILLEEHPDALVLPTTAILHDTQQPTCMCIEADAVKEKPVQLGLRNGTEIEIASGITAADTVVLARGESLKEGQKVEVMAPE